MTNDLYGIAAALHDRGILTFDEVTTMRENAQNDGLHLSTYLLKNQIISGHELKDICQDYFRVQAIDITELDTELIQSNLLQQELVERYHVIPIKKLNDLLTLGMTDPSDHEAIAAIRFHTSLRIQPALISEDDYQRTVNTYYRPNILYSQLQDALVKFDNENKAMDSNEEQPVIQFVEQLLLDAQKKNVSDIHIEFMHKNARVRCRQDGLLHYTTELPTEFTMRMVTRIKVMAKIDIAERRLPQDGRFLFQQKIDIRVNTCPALYGEKLVLRLLNGCKDLLTIEDLGMLPQQRQLLESTLNKPQGLIIVTGPTGSGKTATLYAAINYLNQIERNILTVEDPIEIELDGITQININPHINLTFAKTLRALLRQDPDVIMIGEIRDLETAETAIQAAQTGHLVLSTLHTKNAKDVMTRLQAIGIPPYLIEDSLSLVIAQRLLRKKCTRCEDGTCSYCHGGYFGRVGIFELLAIHPTIHLHENQVEVDMYQAGLALVKQGVTTMQELQRVTGISANED